jgi:hypothetical protein
VWLQQGAEALRDISFKVLPGQICAILSPEFKQRKCVPPAYACVLFVGLVVADRGVVATAR